MEQAHATHKDAAWGWFAVLVGLLDGFPHHGSRPARARQAPLRPMARKPA